MTVSIRPADLPDLGAMVDLLEKDAEDRRATDPVLWKLKTYVRAEIETMVRAGLESGDKPFRQKWLLAEADGRAVGLIHSILLPVPPIYAGEFGPPGLVMEDSYVDPDAPAATARMLLDAAETDLAEAGARYLLASGITGGTWEKVLTKEGYRPLTLYLGKSGLTGQTVTDAARSAIEADVPAIVTLSAENRRVLHELHDFWKPHTEADERFDGWMRKSLNLTDRDMFVAVAEGDVEGYAISQPSTPLHFPAAHDISATGIIDDFYHTDLQETRSDDGNHPDATNLLRAAEAALAVRDNDAVLVVCPADWTSKRRMLEGSGYATALTWFIKT